MGCICDHGLSWIAASKSGQLFCDMLTSLDKQRECMSMI